MAARHWPRLETELPGYLTEASLPSCPVGVFWKLGTQFRFGGGNEHFAHDARLARGDLVGLDDFQRLPIRTAAGAVIGVLGMYDVLDEQTGIKLRIERARTPGRQS